MAYQDVKDRLYRGHRKIARNTYLKLEPVYFEDEHIAMRLHGNLVAVFTQNYIELYSAGWHTQTTKDRLNLALDIAIIPGYIRQMSWQWYYDRPGFLSPAPFLEGMKIKYGG